MLITGTHEGILSIYIFGYWKCATINLSEQVGYKCSIKDALFSDDMSTLFATVTDEFHNIKTIVLNTSIIRDYIEEFYYVSVKYVKLQELMCYLDKVIVNIAETWESILLEIDSKLYNYALKTPTGGKFSSTLFALIQYSKTTFFRSYRGFFGTANVWSVYNNARRVSTSGPDQKRFGNFWARCGNELFNNSVLTTEAHY